MWAQLQVRVAVTAVFPEMSLISGVARGISWGPSPLRGCNTALLGECSLRRQHNNLYAWGSSPPSEFGEVLPPGLWAAPLSADK